MNILQAPKLIASGYSPRKKPILATIIHTTNGRKGSSFENELQFLRTSPNVSAHFLVGKSGQIAQILDVERYAAWHTGATRDPKDSNQYTIGIECHFTPGEEWTVDMWSALTWLVQQFPYPLKMHREIAHPPGRKIDPSGVTDAWFYAWKKHLRDCNAFTLDIATFRTQPKISANNRLYTLHGGKTFGYWVEGEEVYRSNQWLHTPWGYVHYTGIRL